jgi:hypothetical protein
LIRINLTPPEELDSQYWWVPDAAVAVFVFGIAFFAVDFYLGTIRDETAQVNSQAQSLNQSYAQIKPDLDKYNNLEKDIDELNKKLNSLKNITVSKIAKYKPVIVMEHLQNLKPEGVWFWQANISKSNQFEIVGQGFDNILIAEFLTSLRATESHEVDSSDLRTQLFFTDLKLEESNAQKAGRGEFPELNSFPEFTIKGSFGERGGMEQIPMSMGSETVAFNE